MPENPLTAANRLIDESISLNAGDATRFLFDHYRCAGPDMQDAIVLALIGSVLTNRAMRVVGATLPIAPAAQDASP